MKESLGSSQMIATGWGNGGEGAMEILLEYFYGCIC